MNADLLAGSRRRRPAPHVPRLARANLLPPPAPEAAAAIKGRARPTPETVTRRFDRPSFVLAALWLVLWAIEPFAGVSAAPAFQVAEGLIWGAFAGELVLRVALARPRGAYVRHHWWDPVVVVVPALRLLRPAGAGRLLPARLTQAASRPAFAASSAEGRLVARVTTITVVAFIAVAVSARLLFDAGGVAAYATALRDAALGVLGGQGFPHRPGVASAIEVFVTTFHTVALAALAASIGAFFLRRP